MAKDEMVICGKCCTFLGLDSKKTPMECPVCKRVLDQVDSIYDPKADSFFLELAERECASPKTQPTL